MKELGLMALPDRVEGAGVEMHEFCAYLYPLMRSLTGAGVRETLRRIDAVLQPAGASVVQTEIPSGTQAFDWTVPPEWTVRAAWINGPDGRRMLDVADHTLHLMNYSAPFRGRMPLAELRKHLHTLPDRPDWIPYRTSYFKLDWAFCLSHNAVASWPEGEYEVCVDTALEPGHLTFGECILPGETQEEVIFCAHICHPSLVNDNLSGVSTLTWLARILAAQPRRRYTYRFLFVPATVGVVTWLAHRQAETAHIRHGLVVSGVGDPGHYHYKQSRRGNTAIDRIMAFVLQQSGQAHEVNPFIPYGYDERQFCSPGFNLPVGCLARSTYGSYPQYHTSADNLDLVQPQYLQETLNILVRAVSILENDCTLQNLSPMGEPQLGKRGLYSLIGGHNESQKFQLAMLWVLNLSDGDASLLDIAARAALPFDMICEAAQALAGADLVQRIQEPS